ncbi:GNAT family N-acetyltransferase [Methylocystis sp. Sn-Cys]|uniref:GNAT family N-acetyltransferase n=1 Tax=Methylocystis sp. Sn-Cys TaxID=1701263 RepID=UPI001FF051A8|nr:GNAT family N-acetyltransferase [Methylocystis sp. Sn-Cys]
MRRIVTGLETIRSARENRRVSAAGSMSIDVFVTFEDARGDWAELAEKAVVSPYQSYRFLSAWHETMGRADGARPLLIVARNAAGRPLALLPLCIERHAGLDIALFLGGRECNFNLPLLDPAAGFTEADLRGLLLDSAQRAPIRPDLIYLRNQPRRFEGLDNPLAFQTARDSASFAYGAALPVTVDELAARLSKDTRKKLRKKEARLAERGALSYEHCATGPRAEKIIDALIAQKSARFSDIGAEGALDMARVRALLERLSSGDGEGAIELHALSVGERIVATYAGLVRRGRFSAMLNSFDMDDDIARSSPGELLLHALMRNLVARGMTHFDLGAGEARYKNAVCDETIALCDEVISLTTKGALAAPLFSAFLGLKRYIKQNPELTRLYRRARSLLS